MDKISESEKKRLRSLKEKKQAFKTKGQLIQQALSNVDNTTKSNKKIIFHDDADKLESFKSREKEIRNLFNDDNDEEESLWNEDEFSIEKNKHKKIVLGNDTRFTLDDRFAEYDHKTLEVHNVKSSDENDLQKEKERQLDILERLLGTPLAAKNQQSKTTKKGVMIRYDPTENEHSKYEIKPIISDTKEKMSKKKKRDKSVAQIEEPTRVEVSKDIYYTVSDTLTQSLKEKEEFSLLKIYGREQVAEPSDTVGMENNIEQKFSFNFPVKNAFKYDSSDNEDVKENAEEIVEQVENNSSVNNLFGCKNTLFLDNNDVRFNEAVKFFNQGGISNNDFKNLRRELKMIVRKKIRKNEKKRQPWGNKKKIKRS